MTIPDFGNHVTDFESGGHVTKLSCKYMVPGMTFQDLMKVYYDAEAEAKPGERLAGNPAKWPAHRGVYAVTQAILKAIYEPTADGQSTKAPEE